MVTGPTHTNIIFDAVVPHNFPLNDKQIKENIQNLIHNTYNNYYAVVKIDKLYVSDKK